jgi:uncharacterized protein YcbK (DUF882 family)
MAANAKCACGAEYESWGLGPGWCPRGCKVSNFKYFSDAEVAGLEGNLPAMLDVARGIAGIPFVITSGKRTPEQETVLKGGVRDSTHILGLAVDLECKGDNALFLMAKGLLASGFRRLGFYHDKNFQVHHIHVDIGSAPDFPQDCIWLKLEQN